MPLITTRECAVFGTLKAKCWRMTIVEIFEDGRQGEAKKWEVDLSDRAYERLIQKIEQGVTPPGKRKTKEGGGDGDC